MNSTPQKDEEAAGHDLPDSQSQSQLHGNHMIKTDQNLPQEPHTVDLVAQSTASPSAELTISSDAALALNAAACLGPNDLTNGPGVLKEKPTPVHSHSPWPEPVNGVDVLNDMASTTRRFMVMAEEQIDLTALWCFTTHLFEEFDLFPRIYVNAPQHSCGKSTIMQLITTFVQKGNHLTSVSPSALMRSISKRKHTPVLDERDSFKNEGLKVLFKAGYEKATSMHELSGSQDTNYETQQFDVFAPMALSGIGRLDPIVESRCFIIQLQRSKPGEKRPRLRSRKMKPMRDLGRKAARWALDNMAKVREFDLDSLEDKLDQIGVSGRDADNLEPLLAVAEIVGGEWPERARKAAVWLYCKDKPATQSTAEKLLSDIRDEFDASGESFLHPDDLVEKLKDRLDGYWSTYAEGVGLTSGSLTSLLRPFNIVRAQKDCQGENKRVYRRQDFEDAFERYVPDYAAISLADVRTLESAESLGSS
jgi:putative DNA primase/helicase